MHLTGVSASFDIGIFPHGAEGEIRVELFDHVIGGRKQCGRHGEVECIRRFEINNKFELCRLLGRDFRDGSFRDGS
jgi:hypothetical protein